jgi:Rrf2 family protein
MKLTTKSEYALLILIRLARTKALPGSSFFVRLEEICTEYDLSMKYAEQQVSALKKSGMVISKRGAGGGYQLAKQPEDISLAQVIRLMDGALAPIGSVSKYFPSHTRLESEAGVIAVMRDIRDSIALKMEQTKLSYLL